MNKSEFSALPPDLQRDVRLAVALGWPLESVRCDGETVDVRENRMAAFPWRRFDPTQSREIWGGVLEFWLYRGIEITIEGRKGSRKLGEWVVRSFIRRDPFGHLGRAGL